MPAGDAGLERQTRRECEFDPDHLYHDHREADELCAQLDRLQAQLAAQQAVVDAARDYRQSVIDMMHTMETGGDVWRMARERRVNAESRMFSGLAALDKAQAAQPEGEPR